MNDITITHADFGHVMEHRLRAAGVSRSTAAAKMGVSPTMLARKLVGRSRVYLSDLVDVAEMVGTDPLALWDEALKVASARTAAEVGR